MRVWKQIVVVAFVVGVCPLLAERGAAQAQPRQERASAAASASASGSSAGAVQAREAEAIVARMEMAAATIDRVYRKARGDAREPARAACVREKLVQAEVTLRSARVSKEGLGESAGGAEAVLRGLRGQGQRVAGLVAQARGCLGSGGQPSREGVLSYHPPLPLEMTAGGARPGDVVVVPPRAP